MVSEAEYLATSYEYDCEWIDGDVVERGTPTPGHARAQARIGLLTGAPGSALTPFGGLRVKTGSRYRVIDFCMYAERLSDREVPSKPPLVAVEILSPDDKMSAVLDKLEEYRAWGVPHIWLADPLHRVLYRFDDGLRAVDSVSVPDHGIRVAAADLFR